MSRKKLFTPKRLDKINNLAMLLFAIGLVVNGCLRYKMGYGYRSTTIGIICRLITYSSIIYAEVIDKLIQNKKKDFGFWFFLIIVIAEFMIQIAEGE